MRSRQHRSTESYLRTLPITPQHRTLPQYPPATHRISSPSILPRFDSILSHPIPRSVCVSSPTPALKAPCLLARPPASVCRARLWSIWPAGSRPLPCKIIARSRRQSYTVDWRRQSSHESAAGRVSRNVTRQISNRALSSRGEHLGRAAAKPGSKHRRWAADTAPPQVRRR